MNDRNDYKPHFATIAQWRVISGMGRSATYDALSRGDLKAIKMGRRTLIDVRYGLRFLRSRAPAKIKLKRAPPQAEPVAQD